MKNFLFTLHEKHSNGEFSSFIQENAELLFEVLPQLKGLDKVQQDPRWHPEGDVWTHTLLVIQNLPPNATFAMALAALFHDVGKKEATVILENGCITAHGHEAVSERISREMLQILGADESLIMEVLFLVRHHMIAHSNSANARTLRRLIKEGGFELVDQLLQHGVADVASGCRDFTDCKRLREVIDSLK